MHELFEFSTDWMIHVDFLDCRACTLANSQ